MSNLSNHSIERTASFGATITMHSQRRRLSQSHYRAHGGWSRRFLFCCEGGQKAKEPKMILNRKQKKRKTMTDSSTDAPRLVCVLVCVPPLVGTSGCMEHVITPYTVCFKEHRLEDYPALLLLRTNSDQAAGKNPTNERTNKCVRASGTRWKYAQSLSIVASTKLWKAGAYGVLTCCALSSRRADAVRPTC